MDISINWLNQYLSPGDVTPDEADAILTEAGLPIESRTPLPDHGQGGDVVLDVEVTSNRVDCLGHVGIAREIAAARHAKTQRTLVLPKLEEPSTGPSLEGELTLDNRVPDRCPLFTARLIRGIKIGPSPAWLKDAIEAFGQRSINNVVDVTNYITLELGNPCHVFDHKKLAGGALIVRQAEPGEKVKTLYAGEHALRATDLVVADAERPQSLAGIIGGHDSQVDDSTTDVVFEMATWAPVTVRNTARRLNIRTDAAFRFERGIDPRTIDYAARRAVQLICQVSGGTLAEGVLSQGRAMPEDRVVEVRPKRVAQILGAELGVELIASLLEPLGIRCETNGQGPLRCTIPPHRSHDLTREIDLIEEIARARSLGEVELKDRLEIRVHAPQRAERLQDECARTLAGLGFHEAVTFSFTSPKKGDCFMPAGREAVAVDDNRRKAEPTLRPSVLLGLLGCRRANADARNARPGGIRLFETAATFCQVPGTTQTDERRSLALLADVDFSGKKPTLDDTQRAVRVVRGAIDALVRACFGPDASVRVEASEPNHHGFEKDAHASVWVVNAGQETALGSFGVVSAAALKLEGLDVPVVGADLSLDVLTGAPVPKTVVSALPQFPGIERDLSLIVPESVTWASVESLVEGCGLERRVGTEMVGVYRGKQLGAGKKSVTVRVRFRDEGRTMRHEEVDPEMDRLADRAKAELGAEIRG